MIRCLGSFTDAHIRILNPSFLSGQVLYHNDFVLVFDDILLKEVWEATAGASTEAPELAGMTAQLLFY